MVTEPRRVTVSHAAGQYEVSIGRGQVGDLAAIAERVLPGRRLVVIADRTVGRLVAQPLKVPVLLVPAGESAKTRRRWADLTDQLLDLGLGRDGALVAFGGGVVGDLAGFVAATFLRGIPYLQVPTSLLAMVDASVGGKTGVNTHHGKNLVGAFHPPAAVIADPGVLTTLGRTHLRGGLIEAVKHGLVADAEYYDWIEAQAEPLLARDPTALATLVERSVRIKGEVVGADERESGRRAVLNAGHTVGHALERLAAYRLPHGEAVAAGLVVEGVVAEALGLAPEGLAADLTRRLRALGWQGTLPADDDGLLAAMRHDKKVRGTVIQMALPRAPGGLAAEAGGWTTATSDDIVRQSLGAARRLLDG